MSSARGWSGDGSGTTRLVLLRHGVTEHTAGKRFSGGLTGVDPALTDEGREQVLAACALLPAQVDALVTSPMRRTRESAAIVAERLGLEPQVEPGLAETDFGGWEGMTFGEIRDAQPEQLDAWLASMDVPAGGTGESFRVVAERVLAARDRVLASYAGRTVVVVSHVTPIKVLVADAVGAPLEALYRMELGPAAVSEVAYHPQPSLRSFNRSPGSK